MSQLIAQLKRHEGFRALPYQCSEGTWTNGYGNTRHVYRNTAPVSEAEAEDQLAANCARAIRDCGTIPIWQAMRHEVRRAALVNLCFNIGLTRIRGFHRMWAAIAAEDWENAARELLDSRYRRQVGARAYELAYQLWSGKWWPY